MPPRLSLLPAVRHLNGSCIGTRAFSSAWSTAAPAPPSPSATMLSLDNSPARKPSAGATEAVRGLLRGAAARSARHRETMLKDAAERMRAQKLSDEYVRFMPRRWEMGDVYAPHDLSVAEMRKWGRFRPRQRDLVDKLNINPVDMYKNFSMVSEYMTSFGQIKHSKDTGLRPANQRKMAKAVRRAIGLGIHPSVHRHPEILQHELINFKRFSN